MTSPRRQQRAARLTGIPDATPTAGQNEHGVPLELFDLDAPPWRSRAAAAAWYRNHDMGDPRQLQGGETPAHRLHSAIIAFAIATGRTSQPDGRTPDTRWLVAVGLARVQQQCTRRKLATTTRHE